MQGLFLYKIEIFPQFRNVSSICFWRYMTILNWGSPTRKNMTELTHMLLLSQTNQNLPQKRFEKE